MAEPTVAVEESSRAAYGRRAAEYVAALGSMSAVHPSDRVLVSTWAERVDGPILDAGCGPGHWTHFLADQGHAARGVDQVPDFIQHARTTYSREHFALGDIDTLDAAPRSLGGILSWYSLIHHEPPNIRTPLRGFARALAPGGMLLLGFFEGPVVERFAHAVTPAYRWPVDDLSAELDATGFDVLESHVRKVTGERPLAAIVARTRPAP